MVGAETAKEADMGTRADDTPELLAVWGTEVGFKAGEDEDWITMWSPVVGWRTLEAGWGAPAT